MWTCRNKEIMQVKLPTQAESELLKAEKVLWSHSIWLKPCVKNAWVYTTGWKGDSGQDVKDTEVQPNRIRYNPNYITCYKFSKWFCCHQSLVIWYVLIPWTNVIRLKKNFRPKHNIIQHQEFIFTFFAGLINN